MNNYSPYKIWLIGLTIVAINFSLIHSLLDAATWETIAEQPQTKEIISYDKESIVRPAKDIVRIWAKTQYNKDVEEMKDYTLSLFEINCNLREWHILKSITYLKEGWHEKDDPDKNYYESTTYPSKWEALIPVESSMISILFHNGCSDAKLPNANK